MHKKFSMYIVLGLSLFTLPSFTHEHTDSPASEVSENTQPIQNSVSTASPSHSYNQALYDHWIALARLYEEQGDMAMAELAYGYAKQLMPDPIINIEEPIIEPQPEEADNIFFRQLKSYLNGWFENDEQQIIAVTAPVLLLPLYSDGLMKTEQVAFFQEFFTSYPQLAQLAFDDIYDVDTLMITQFDNSKAMLSIRSRNYPPLSLKEWNYWSNFWNNTHHYFFQKMADNQWYLLAFDMDEEDESNFFINQEQKDLYGTS